MRDAGLWVTVWVVARVYDVSPERVLADVKDGAGTYRSGTPSVGGEDAEVVTAGVRAGLEDGTDHFVACLLFFCLDRGLTFVP